VPLPCLQGIECYGGWFFTADYSPFVFLLRYSSLINISVFRPWPGDGARGWPFYYLLAVLSLDKEHISTQQKNQKGN